VRLSYFQRLVRTPAQTTNPASARFRRAMSRQAAGSTNDLSSSRSWLFLMPFVPPWRASSRRASAWQNTWRTSGTNVLRASDDGAGKMISPAPAVRSAHAVPGWGPASI